MSVKERIQRLIKLAGLAGPPPPTAQQIAEELAAMDQAAAPGPPGECALSAGQVQGVYADAPVPHVAADRIDALRARLAETRRRRRPQKGR